jgi:hypothetical protein
VAHTNNHFDLVSLLAADKLLDICSMLTSSGPATVDETGRPLDKNVNGGGHVNPMGAHTRHTLPALRFVLVAV